MLYFTDLWWYKELDCFNHFYFIFWCSIFTILLFMFLVSPVLIFRFLSILFCFLISCFWCSKIQKLEVSVLLNQDQIGVEDYISISFTHFSLLILKALLLKYLYEYPISSTDCWWCHTVSYGSSIDRYCLLGSTPRRWYPLPGHTLNLLPVQPASLSMSYLLLP